MIVPPRPPGPHFHSGDDIRGTPEEMAVLRAETAASAARIRAYGDTSGGKLRAPAPPAVDAPLTLPPLAFTDPDEAAPLSAATVRWAEQAANRLPWPSGDEMKLTTVWATACRRHQQAVAAGDTRAAAASAAERAAARERLVEFTRDLSAALLLMLRYAIRHDRAAAAALVAELVEPHALRAEVADLRSDVDMLAQIVFQIQDSPAVPAEVCP